MAKRTNKIRDMKTAKFTLDPKVKESLVYKLSELLTFLLVEKKIKANDMATRLGINTAALSFLKNNKCKKLSDMRVIIAAVSFKIITPEFNPDQYLVALHSTTVLRDHPLGSNLYDGEIEEFNSWIHKAERDVFKDLSERNTDMVMFGTRMHEELEAEITCVIPGFGLLPERKSKPIPDTSRFDPSKYISRQTAEEISKYAGTVESITTERDELNHILADYDRLKKRRDDLNQILTLMKNNLL